MIKQIKFCFLKDLFINKKAIFLLNFVFIVLSSFVISGKVFASVYITEFMPDPNGSDSSREWVELYNDGNVDINVTNWKIQSYNGSEEINDNLIVNSDRNKVITTNITIPAKSYIVITDTPNNTEIFPSYSAFLNNNTFNLYQKNATIILRNNDNQIVDFLSYGNTLSGKSWEVDGPLCKNLVLGNPHSANNQNYNHNPNCWPQNDSDDDSSDEVNLIPELDYLKFSLDGNNWFDQIDTWAPARVHVSFKFKNYEIGYFDQIKLKIDDTEVTSPFVIDRDFSESVFLEVTKKGSVYIFESLPHNFTLIDQDKLVNSIEFSTDAINWSESILTENNASMKYRVNFGYSNLQIDEVSLFTKTGDLLPNPFIIDQYSDELLLSVKVAGQTYSFVTKKIYIYPKIIINEYLLNSSESLWIEIYNPNNFVVKLQNFSIKMGSHSFYISQQNATDCGHEISPDSYCVISFGESQIQSPIQSIDLYYLDTHLESVPYIEAPTDQSVSLFDGEYLFENMLVTKNAKNEPKPFEEEVIRLMITEIYPSPNTSIGEIEWIEIFNAGSNDVLLSNFYLKDKGSGSDGFGNTKSFLPMMVLKSGEYVVIYDPDLKITLNNSGDHIGLFDLKNNLIDFVSYPTSISGISWARRFQNGTYEPIFYNDIVALTKTKILTPGEVNKFDSDEDGSDSVGNDGDDMLNSLSLITIQEAKSKQNGNYVFVEGIVTVDKNVLGVNTFYIQDKTSAIRVELESSINLNVSQGEYVRLYGLISESYSERKLKISNVVNILKISEQDLFFALEDIEYKTLNFNDLEELEGNPVFVEGEIIENYSSSMDIQTNAGSIRISLLSSTGINVNKSKGDKVSVYGILSQYNGLYRILPRYVSDISIVKKQVNSLNQTKSSTLNKNNSKSSIIKKSVQTPEPQILSLSTTRLDSEQIYDYTPLSLENLVIPEIKNNSFFESRIPIYVILFFVVLFIYWYIFDNSIINPLKFFKSKSSETLSEKEKDFLKKYYDT